MGMDVRLTINTAAVPEMAALRRRAILAGGEVILGIADARAPRDSGAMIESGTVELEVGEFGDRAVIIYRKFYAIWQETKDYRHPVGQGRFLEFALTGGHVAAFERVAAVLRESAG